MADAPRLDPRPARPLTTREIAKVIGATVGSTAGLFGSERARAMLRAVAAMLRGEIITGSCEQGEAMAAALLFGQASALADWCAPDDVLTAVTWWIEREGALESLEAIHFEAIHDVAEKLTRGGGRGLA